MQRFSLNTLQLRCISQMKNNRRRNFYSVNLVLYRDAEISLSVIATIDIYLLFKFPCFHLLPGPGCSKGG